MTLESTLPIGYARLKKPDLHWVRMGVPVKRGELPINSECQLLDHNWQVVESDINVQSRWHDGSAKWVLIDGLVEREGALFLRSADGLADAGPKLARQQPVSIVITSDNCINVDGIFRIKPPVVTLSDGQPLALSVFTQENDCDALIEKITITYLSERLPHFGIDVSVSYCSRTQESEVRLTVYNSAASEHKNGCWDLGDPNSLDLKSLVLAVEHSQQGGEVSLLGHDEKGQEIHHRVSGQVWVNQFGSGGEHWDSPVHQDKTGNISVKAQGFTIEDTELGSVREGKRIVPEVRVGGSESFLFFSPDYFWQNTPAALQVDTTSFRWHMFSQSAELQPGESKTWSMSVKPKPEKAEFYPEAEYVNRCNVLLGVLLFGRNDFSSILDTAIDGNASFFQKREQCDEYGWRHFGDLYADHEALYTEAGSGIFVSHYNNQYDPLMGFQLRFMSSAEPAWAELAQALKQHIYDIDLYKTECDKAEYNHGLFWHTDHYLPALTATHRTYSAKHTAAYDGHQGGGGPGGQHCYTTGLALHYWLTGDEQSRMAVLNLMRWVRCFYNGPDSLLSRLYRFLTIDLKPGQLTNIGLVPVGYKYPLDRGTANYLNALIDGYQIEPSDQLLDELFSVIRQTLSPCDNLNERKLSDIENAWFYIVFLQALARYLLLKEQLEQIDDAYAYSRQCYIYYARWVLENEQPYLTTPKQLEFPNDTWAAQDLRKANVLYYAAYFDLERSQEHHKRAEFFWRYCADHLADSEERSTTRVLAILMQNQGVREWQQQTGTSVFPLHEVEPRRFPKIGPLRRLMRDSLHILGRFSLSTEWHWLKTRLVR